MAILAEPMVPRTVMLGARLESLAKPVKKFFDQVPEIKACAFAVISPEAPARQRQDSPLGVTWSNYYSWESHQLPMLEQEDRFPASAWRLENAAEAITIASFCLLEFPSSAGSAAGLLALRSGFYWVHDVGILGCQVPALGSYPKNPIVPLFPSEPSGHQLIAAEPNFVEAFPAVEEAIARSWGRDFLN